MATFSSHLLDATNGSHAANVDVIIYQINENGKKKVFCETKSDEGGRILQEFELSKDDCNCCLLYTSPSPRDATLSRMPSSA